MGDGQPTMKDDGDGDGASDGAALQARRTSGRPRRRRASQWGGGYT